MYVTNQMEHTFRVFDFNVYNAKSDSSDDEQNTYKNSSNFMIQMFGLNKAGETCSIIAENYKPFFYVMVNDKWTISMKDGFIAHIKDKIGKYYSDSITGCKIIKRKKLYGFDGGKEHKFIKIEFSNMPAFTKVQNLWYSSYDNGHVLLANGYKFNNTDTKIYESNIPPLLRFFHIQEISPSGWIALPKNKTVEFKGESKKSHCTYEFEIDYKHIISLNDNEDRVPYKICSFDIEASSSHGDFPVPVKSYKKLATNIIEHFENLKQALTPDLCKNMLKRIILAAFGFEQMDKIDLVYPKKKVVGKQEIERMCELWLQNPVRDFKKTDEFNSTTTLESLFEKMSVGEDEDEDHYKSHIKSYTDNKATIANVLCDAKFEREGKLNELNISLNSHFPKLEGDKVTFIGSTFMNYGDKDPYMNHCIALNTCSKLTTDNTIIESYNTERDVLLAWQKLIQRENPDIIIGYNIFGFDYQFMFKRAEENECMEDFLKLSRNKDEICGEIDKETGKYKLAESSIHLASGQHDIYFIKINGRLQVDLYNFYRREANLTSYKLDYVAGYFIGDYVKSIKTDGDSASKTTVHTSNMTGLLVGSFVHFEEIGHSVDYYADGAKFMVTEVNKTDGVFSIAERISPDMKKKVRWCLAKDDVTPKDIFRLSNGTAEDRGIVAKYCIQDCNLVHYLFNKSDVLTGYIEMSKICSVPINFLVMRGQGIKLTSYIAKKCREKRTLMPVIEKGGMDEGYEGAIVLEPKCDLYLDNPVACVDYASLYPSSMISENLSHDSKVWTKSYNLNGDFIEELGEKNERGEFQYDNLAGYEYVNVTYDTYKYVKKSIAAATYDKIKTGHKICRFAQPLSDANKAIMPSILEELLKARKSTRKLIPQQSDDFMKQVLEQRQLGYKLTANSLYGQCGAKTSTFYEQDIAACTTSIGRLLLIYAKKLIEECYGNKICNTNGHGPVLTKAEYIYGDSVANYTPVYVRVNNQLDILTIEDLAEKYGSDNWIVCKEPGKQDKEFCELGNVETWTEKGWTKLYRVIRHELASHKKMMRVLTHTGLVDVTDDHSLILKNGEEISPKDINIGTELLHYPNPIENNNPLHLISKEEAQLMGFFFEKGECTKYSGYVYGSSHSWSLSIPSTEILIDKYLTLCKKVYPTFEWVIRPTRNFREVIICPQYNKSLGGLISELVNKYINVMYYKQTKRIPAAIMLEKSVVRRAFVKGLCHAYKQIDANIYITYQSSQIMASHISWLAQSIGLNTSINVRNNINNPYIITININASTENPNAIKKIHEIEYSGYVYDLTTENHHFAAGVGNMIVHNTDSVFFTFNLQTLEGKPIRGKEALEITIELAQEAGHLASSFLKAPHDLEYEKTFMPFCLLSKKRYVGMLYETDPNKGKRKEMGIVLKRRDNAPIVKDIYGGIIDILMKEQNIQQATDFLKASLQKIVEEKYPVDKLIITKSLRSGYKKPNSIAHKVLADRITSRDPGNKPSSGDRIPYVYIHTQNKKALQGEKIETPAFIKENNLKIDYSFYITNQIMKPVQQLFALVLEKMWENNNKMNKIKTFKASVETLRKTTSPEKFEDKLEQLKNKEVKALLFDSYLRETNNEKAGNQNITKYFGKK